MTDREQQLENYDVELEDNNYDEEQQNLLYMIFQYDVDSYYVGMVDSRQLNDGSYAFNILYPLAIYLDEDNRYKFSELNNLGDSQYPLNLNKNEVIAIFSPNAIIIQNYDEIIQRLHNKNNNTFIDDYTKDDTDILIYEVTNIQ